MTLPFQSVSYWFLAALILVSPNATSDTSDDALMLEDYAVYESPRVIFGSDGREYHKSNPALRAAHQALVPQIEEARKDALKELKDLRQKWLERRTEYHDAIIAPVHELAKAPLSNRLSRDTYFLDAFINRLEKGPLIEIKNLIYWNGDYLNSDTRYTYGDTKLKYDPQSESWNRRVMVTWDIVKGMPLLGFSVELELGLNLDSNSGFRYVSGSTKSGMSPNSIKVLKLDYPIVLYSDIDHDAQADEIVTDFRKNMATIHRSIWGPEPWDRHFYHMDTELTRNVFRDVLGKFKDKGWLSRSLSTYLTDSARIKIEGEEKFYSYSANLPNLHTLGESIDYLNWTDSEDRKKPTQLKNRSSFKEADVSKSKVARLVMLQVYREFGDEFWKKISPKLLTAKKGDSGKEVVQETIAQLSGEDFDSWIRRALDEQMSLIESAKVE